MFVPAGSEEGVGVIAQSGFVGIEASRIITELPEAQNAGQKQDENERDFLHHGKATTRQPG